MVVPTPTLLPDTEIGELPTAEVPVKTGTVLVVPLPVTVCAAAPTDANAKPIPSHMHADFVIISIPSFPWSFAPRPRGLLRV